MVFLTIDWLWQLHGDYVDNDCIAILTVMGVDGDYDDCGMKMAVMKSMVQVHYQWKLLFKITCVWMPCMDLHVTSWSLPF